MRTTPIQGSPRRTWGNRKSVWNHLRGLAGSLTWCLSNQSLSLSTAAERGRSLTWNQRSSTSPSWPRCSGAQKHLSAARGRKEPAGCRHASSRASACAGGSRRCASSWKSTSRASTCLQSQAGNATRRRLILNPILRLYKVHSRASEN